MTRKIFIGVDPGFGGAIGVIAGKKVFVRDMPVFTNDKSKKFYNVSGVRTIFLPYVGKRPKVVVELVHSMPGQGVVSTFRFGEGFGIIQGVIIGLGLELKLVSPQVWKKEIFGRSGTTKEDSRQKALELFPSLAKDLRRKMDEGRAEAMLIAEYGKREHMKKT